MADDDNVHNATVDILRKIQADIATFRHDVTERFDRSDTAVAELQVAIAAIRTGQAVAAENLDKIAETQQVHGARLNIIDARLATIEKHTGLVKA